MRTSLTVAGEFAFAERPSLHVLLVPSGRGRDAGDAAASRALLLRFLLGEFCDDEDAALACSFL